jgi:hypothetical protein
MDDEVNDNDLASSAVAWPPPDPTLERVCFVVLLVAVESSSSSSISGSWGAWVHLGSGLDGNLGGGGIGFDLGGGIMGRQPGVTSEPVMELVDDVRVPSCGELGTSEGHLEWNIFLDMSSGRWQVIIGATIFFRYSRGVSKNSWLCSPPFWVHNLFWITMLFSGAILIWAKYVLNKSAKIQRHICSYRVL